MGAAFAPIAVEKGVAQPYKTSHWNSVPDWAKDKDGNLYRNNGYFNK